MLLGFKSLTSNPSARADPKLPVTGTTTSVTLASQAKVDTKTEHRVIIEVTMPYSKAEFDNDKQVTVCPRCIGRDRETVRARTRDR